MNWGSGWLFKLPPTLTVHYEDRIVIDETLQEQMDLMAFCHVEPVRDGTRSAAAAGGAGGGDGCRILCIFPTPLPHYPSTCTIVQVPAIMTGCWPRPSSLMQARASSNSASSRTKCCRMLRKLRTGLSVSLLRMTPAVSQLSCSLSFSVSQRHRCSF